MPCTVLCAARVFILLILIPTLRWRNGGTEAFIDWPEMTPLISGGEFEPGSLTPKSI